MLTPDFVGVKSCWLWGPNVILFDHIWVIYFKTEDESLEFLSTLGTPKVTLLYNIVFIQPTSMG